MESNRFLDELTSRYPELATLREEILKASECLISCYRHGQKVLVCGNGGSAADADHIVGELMKGFERRRPVAESLRSRLLGEGAERGSYLAGNLQQGLPAISLGAHSALISAISNDTGADLVYAQQVVGYGKKGDVLIALSTSGNSRNVLDAAVTARAIGMAVIGFTGESGGKMKSLCDILINVPGTHTAFVQELHMPVYHAICRLVEDHFFGH